MSSLVLDAGAFVAWIAAAINGSASALVTHNVGDFRLAAARFGVRVLTPREILKELSK